MRTYGRSESPQGYEVGSHSLPSPSPRPTVQGAPGVDIIDRPVGSSTSTTYSPYTENARSTRQSASGSGAARPTTPVAQEITSAPVASHGDAVADALTVLPIPAISSPQHGPLNLSDGGQSGAAPNFE